MTDLIKRPFDEEYDTMMAVERNPCGAWMAIQAQADHIEELVKERKAMAMRDAGYDVYAGLEAKLAKAEKERDEYKDAAKIWQEDFIQENQRLYVAQVKLAIAVEALLTIVDNGGAGSYHLARATLAEIKGESHE